MSGEIETLLKLYKEGKIDKERFIAYAPAGIPKDIFADLIDDFDAGKISDKDFISIAKGMIAVPPPVKAPPPEAIDLFEMWRIFERTKTESGVVKDISKYRYVIKPFLSWLIETGLPADKVTPSKVMDFIREYERIMNISRALKKKYDLTPAEVGIVKEAIKAYYVDKCSKEEVEMMLEPVPNSEYVAKEVIALCEYLPEDLKYSPSYVQTIRKDIKTFFGFLEEEIEGFKNPLARMKIGKMRGSPDTFNIEVEHGKLVSSEMNPIYEALYAHPHRFDDWRRVELGIRLMRETGLRFEHAKLIQFADIILTKKEYGKIPCGGVVTYTRLKPFERPRKRLPRITTPISPLFAKRITTYLEIHPEITPTEPLFAVRLRAFEDQLTKLRVLGDIPYRIYPKKFRKAFGTLIVNIEPKPAMWTQLTGDSTDTLWEHYADDTLSIVYDGMGLKGYADIVNLIFGAEGLLEMEKPPKRPVGRPRKKQAFILPE